MTGVSADISTDNQLPLTVNYTYTNDLLTEIQTRSTIYNFTYNEFDLREKVSIGNYTLATYSYKPENHYLDRLDYGNGDSVKYTRDALGRVTGEEHKDGETLTDERLYAYAGNGELAISVDADSGLLRKYLYDKDGRAAGVELRINGSLELWTTMAYNAHGQLSSNVTASQTEHGTTTPTPIIQTERLRN